MERKLEGRVAVVTGASSGIGAATARALAAEGASVALLARRQDRIEELAGTIGGRALPIAADVRSPEQLVAAAARVHAELGRASILVNNAGQMLNSPFDARLADEWRAMVEINLMGAISATDAFLDQLVDGGGDLVNISSVAGRKARATTGVYSATKWGVNGWSEALRQELQGRAVRVILVEPGAVATELVDHITHPETRTAAERLYAGGTEILRAEDIAEIIAFAVSRPERVALNEILVRPLTQEY